MKKKCLLACLIPFLVACSFGASSLEESHTSYAIDASSLPSQEVQSTMNLYVGAQLVPVTWEDNASVRALNELAKNGLVLALHEYGGFEQTGLIGQTIVSNDVQMDVDAGDIVLYNSRQICLYYNRNSWSFTRLGKMNLAKEEIIVLLQKDSVTIELKVE